MRRSVWIFLASIFLPSLGLAWLAVRSAQDQQVVLEHQQVIISQNITDALAKNIQAQMDQVRGDFVTTTRQLLDKSSSPQALAQNFNQSLHDVWPMAGIGFAVNLDGEVYSPKPYDGPDAKVFRDENDRFLSNRENAEVYSSNSLNFAQNAMSAIQQKMSAAVQSKIGGYNTSDVIQTRTAAQDGSPARPIFTTDQDEKMDLAKGSLAASGQAMQAMVTETTPTAAAQSVPPEVQTTRTVAPVPMPATDHPTQAELRGELKQTGDRSSLDQGSSKIMPSPSSVDSLSNSMQRAEDKSANATSATGGAAGIPQVSNVTPAASTPGTSMSSSATLAPAAPASLPGGATSSVSSAASAPASTTTENSPVMEDMFNAKAQIQRNVIPQKMLASQDAAISNTVPEESDFRRVIGTETSGELARFLEDKLRLMVWAHPASETPIVFGAQLDQGKVVEALKASFQIPELAQDSSFSSGKSEFCVAILDDTGHPVALSHPGFVGDWKHPFVATEIGEVLPHWEAALYLIDPDQISHAARTLQATVGLIVLLLVAAIVSGGSLIAADVRRQVRLAQQKTDFVSNVSHELKTPLTSIRMFADLLAEKRVPDEERQATYLRIIATEAARLTRLINNVLDFARLERGAPPGEHRACDLVDAVRDVAETCRPHLEAEGISFQLEVEAETLPIRGDRDALAQIILNLVSNAEKYGGKDILMRVRRQEIATSALGCVDVLDRGPGIPAKQVSTIFEPFHRLDDSLASGIPGSGLGLTLARRMARSHGGDVTYSARAGGGSCFTLTVPLETT